MSGWVVDELERILRRLRAERRQVRQAERYAETLHRVEGFLAAHPGASANHVHREIGGRRQDVLRATRTVRARFQIAGNHSQEAAR